MSNTAKPSGDWKRSVDCVQCNQGPQSKVVESLGKSWKEVAGGARSQGNFPMKWGSWRKGVLRDFTIGGVWCPYQNQADVSTSCQNLAKTRRNHNQLYQRWKYLGTPEIRWTAMVTTCTARPIIDADQQVQSQHTTAKPTQFLSPRFCRADFSEMFILAWP